MHDRCWAPSNFRVSDDIAGWEVVCEKIIDDPELSGKVLYHVEYEDGDEADYFIEDLGPLLIPAGLNFHPLRRGSWSKLGEEVPFHPLS